MTTVALRCDWDHDCAEAVSMIDSKGFAYCAYHGMGRRCSGTRCRKLQPYELRRLQRGEQVKRY